MEHYALELIAAIFPNQSLSLGPSNTSMEHHPTIHGLIDLSAEPNDHHTINQNVVIPSLGFGNPFINARPLPSNSHAALFLGLRTLNGEGQSLFEDLNGLLLPIQASVSSIILFITSGIFH